MIDYSKLPGCKPAKAADHRRHVNLYHNQCGQRVNGDPWHNYSCAGPCRVWWKPKVMDAFTDDAMATRFHTRAEPDTAEYAIVWVTSEGKRHTKLVPTSEAHKYERFKL